MWKRVSAWSDDTLLTAFQRMRQPSLAVPVIEEARGACWTNRICVKVHTDPTRFHALQDTMMQTLETLPPSPASRLTKRP